MVVAGGFVVDVVLVELVELVVVEVGGVAEPPKAPVPSGVPSPVGPS